MQYNGEADNQDIVSDITFQLGNSVDLNAYRIEDRTRNVNSRQHDVWFAIWLAYHGWRFVPQDNDPYIQFDVESGTSDIDMGASTITVRFVELLQDGGTWTRLTPLTEEKFAAMGGTSLQETESEQKTGTPRFYILRGNKITLIDTPNYDKTNGIRVHTDPAATDFAVDDSTETPQFASPFHRVLSVGAALDYAASHNMRQANGLQTLWNDYIARITKFYSQRFVDNEPKRIGPGNDLMAEFS